MSVSICEFYYDFSSPFAYLGASQVERVCEGHAVVWKPFLLGALFNEIGTPTVPISTFAPAKAQLAIKDQYRWAEHWDVAFEFPTEFPQKSVTALRLALQAPEEARGALSMSLFELMWVNKGSLNDQEALTRVLDKHGFDAPAMLAGTQDPAVKEQLKANTSEAVARGICGAPSFVVGELVFWGQDRFEFVKKALDGWEPRHG